MTENRKRELLLERTRQSTTQSFRPDRPNDSCPVSPSAASTSGLVVMEYDDFTASRLWRATMLDKEA